MYHSSQDFLFEYSEKPGLLAKLLPPTEKVPRPPAARPPVAQPFWSWQWRRTDKQQTLLPKLALAEAVVDVTTGRAAPSSSRM